MRLKIEDAVSDTQRFVDQLLRFTAQKTIDDYYRDELFEMAVKMNMVLIAEALNRLSRESAEAKRRIPDLGRIIAFRNVIVHSYDIVDEESAWGFFTRYVPELKQQIDAWAAELGMEAPPGPAS